MTREGPMAFGRGDASPLISMLFLEGTHASASEGQTSTQTLYAQARGSMVDTVAAAIATLW